MVKLIQYTGITIVALLFIFAGYRIGKQNVGIDLSQTTKIVGQISNAYLARRPTGSHFNTAPVFAFSLGNLQQTLGVYRPSKDYSSLLNNLRVGDSITVYYKPLESHPIDIDVYQIEKDGQIIVDYKDYSRNHATAALAIEIMGVLLWIISVLRIKYWVPSKKAS